MTRPTEAQNENTHQEEEPNRIRISKRETVAAFYERMLSSARRIGGTVRQLHPAAGVDSPTPSVGADPLSMSAAPHEPAESAPEEAEPEQTPGPRSEAAWNDLISHRIEEAMRNGAFENLRNKGKPLPQEHNPHVPEDRRLANDLLKNNGFAPQWIGDRAAMLHQIDTFRTKFRETATSYQNAWHTHNRDAKKRQQISTQWATQLETWQEEMRRLNRRIDVVNLQQPILRLEIFKLLLDEELKRVGLTRELA